jgi:2-dehydro-3-deoxyphosphogluconate aldolase/(4S)-4-hydroxy-2-oxoglutarate aldolase
MPTTASIMPQLAKADATQSKHTTNQQFIASILKSAPIIPVFAIEDLDIAVPMIQALEKGGIKVVEIAARTPQVFQAVTKLRKECPNVTIGVATIQTVEEMDSAAQFGASPMYSKELIKHAKEINFPYIPCVSLNLSEIDRASKAGFKFLKLFPMDIMSDPVLFLNGMHPMVNKLGVKFCTSALKTVPEQMQQFLSHEDVVSTVCGWTPFAKLATEGNYQAITDAVTKDLKTASDVVATRELELQKKRDAAQAAAAKHIDPKLSIYSNGKSDAAKVVSNDSLPAFKK